eukprot:gene21091-biopygen13167
MPDDCFPTATAPPLHSGRCGRRPVRWGNMAGGAGSGGAVCECIGLKWCGHGLSPPPLHPPHGGGGQRRWMRAGLGVRGRREGTSRVGIAFVAVGKHLSRECRDASRRPVRGQEPLEPGRHRWTREDPRNPRGRVSAGSGRSCSYVGPGMVQHLVWKDRPRSFQRCWNMPGPPYERWPATAGATTFPGIPGTLWGSGGGGWAPRFQGRAAAGSAARAHCGWREWGRFPYPFQRSEIPREFRLPSRDSRRANDTNGDSVAFQRMSRPDLGSSERAVGKKKKNALRAHGAETGSCFVWRGYNR